MRAGRSRCAPARQWPRSSPVRTGNVTVARRRLRQPWRARWRERSPRGCRWPGPGGRRGRRPAPRGPAPEALAVGQRAVGEGGVDAHLVLSVGQAVALALGQAKTPGLAQYEVRYGTQSGCSGSECRCGCSSARASPSPARCSRPRGGWTAGDDHPLPPGADPRSPQVPLARHRPVEHRRAGGNLVDRVRADSLEDANVARRPSPVRLRQIGYSSAMSACMAFPAAAGSTAAGGLADRWPPVTSASNQGSCGLGPR